MSFTPGDWLARRAKLSPGATALIDARSGRSITFAQWDQDANRTARWLAARGVKKGDRVATLAKNRTELLDLWFACGKLGAVLQTLNWRLTPRELTGLLAPAPPSLLALDGSTAAAAREIPHEAAPARFTLDELAQQREAEASGPFEATPVEAEDPWVICYTGGSTGLPKGAVLTHGSMLANAVNTAASWGLGPRDVAILNAPLFHVGGLSVLTAPLVLMGGCSIVCEGFDAGQVIDLCTGGGVTAFFGVPTMFLALLQHPRFAEVDWSRLALVISGGAPCPPAIVEAMWAAGAPFKQGYGLTEAGPNNFWLPPADIRRKPGSVGWPLFQVDARVVDAEGRDCPANQPGELWLRGPHVFAGYFNQPAETARVIDQGWLRTGDVAVADDDGAFSIVGRLKDIIISGGENVYPAEVEAVLASHPGVAEVALIGVPDERWGEVGRAVVVPRGDLDPGDLLAFCAGRLARYKVPKSVVLVAELPRTGAGKIDKPALRKVHGS